MTTMISTLKEVREALTTIYTDAHVIFNNPPGETSQNALDVIEWHNGSVEAALTKLDALIAVHEKAEPVTDDRVDQIAHNVEPGDWNLLAYRDCWHKGFNVGFREAEKEHGIKEKNNG